MKNFSTDFCLDYNSGTLSFREGIILIAFCRLLSAVLCRGVCSLQLELKPEYIPSEADCHGDLSPIEPRLQNGGLIHLRCELRSDLGLSHSSASSCSQMQLPKNPPASTLNRATYHRLMSSSLLLRPGMSSPFVLMSKSEWNQFHSLACLQHDSTSICACCRLMSSMHATRLLLARRLVGWSVFLRTYGSDLTSSPSVGSTLSSSDKQQSILDLEV